MPHGHRYYWKSGFLKELSDEAIDTILLHMESNPSPFSATIFELYGGTASREPEGGSAYPHRELLYDLVIMSNWVDTTDDQVNISWNRKLWEALQPFLSPKVYVNTLSVEGQDRVKEAYGKNYDRLVQLKRKYDPDNFFHMNQNIIPG
ncbi:BBE domain-containing protein [Flavitalea antarctica]